MMFTKLFLMSVALSCTSCPLPIPSELISEANAPWAFALTGQEEEWWLLWANPSVKHLEGQAHNFVLC